MYKTITEKLKVLFPFDLRAERRFSGEVEIEGESGYPEYQAYIEMDYDSEYGEWDVWVGDVYRCLDANNHVLLWGEEAEMIETLIKNSI